MAPGNFRVILQFGFHPLLLSMSLSNGCVPSSFRLTNHGVSFYLESHRERSVFQISDQLT